jgi:hypothetical protein
MTIGPLELVVIGYEGETIPPEIGRELSAVEHRGSVRLVDLAFIEKAPAGDVRVRTPREVSGAMLAPFADGMGDLMGLLRADEIALAVEAIPAGETAIVALFEHTWATGLRDAIRRTGGQLLMKDLLAPERVDVLNAEFAELEMAGE